MRWTPLNMAGGFYSDDAKPWTAQDCCGFLPEPAEVGNTLSPMILRDLPGLRPVVDTGDGAIRGARVVEGKLFVVSGETLYQISNAFVRIPIGRVPGVGAVEMSHNQNAGGNQVLIANGSAGYLYHTGTGDFTRITDDGFPGAKSVDYLDSYFLLTEPAGRYWFNSDLASGTDYSTLDRYEAEYKPDRIVATRALYQDVVVFGAETTEFFYNSGAATGTFQNRQQSFDVGCASAASIVRLDNTLMWLDNKGVFQRLAANNALPVSNRVIERAVSGFNWAGCVGTTWEDKGRKVAIWSFPDGLTVRYDATTGLWHRSQSYGMTRWRINYIVFWNGMWIACDFQSGRIYELDWDYHLEYDQPKVRRVCGGPIHGNGSRVKVDAIKIVADAGNVSTTPGTFPAQPNGPAISGNAPDASIVIGYPGYTYTVTAGSAAIASIGIISGDLPPGLSFSNGTISATYATQPGTYSFRILVKDLNGMRATLDDTIVIQPYAFVAFSDSTEGLWVSADLASWSAKLPFVPSGSNGVYNAVAIDKRLVVDAILSSSGMTEKLMLTGQAPWTGGSVPISSTQTIESGTSLLPSRMYASGSVVAAWEMNSNRTYYWLSQDGGSTYAQINTPQTGFRTYGFARLASGRWVACFGLGGDKRLYYSDQAVPNAWTEAMSGVSTGSSDCLAAGASAYFVDSLNRLFKSSDGASWTQVYDGSAIFPGTPSVFVTSTGGVVVYGANAYGKVAVSHNAGTSFTAVTFDTAGDIIKLTESGGKLIGSPNSGGVFYVSSNDGNAWAKLAVPFSGYGSAATVVAMSFA